MHVHDFDENFKQNVMFKIRYIDHMVKLKFMMMMTNDDDAKKKS